MNFTDNQKWYPLKNFEDYFEITQNGLVRSKPRQIFNGRGYFTTKSKILKYGLAWGKYYSVDLFINNKNFKRRVHRLVAETFIPNPLNLPQVNHKDTDKFNNNVDNLEWCTNKENVNHAHNMGLHDGWKKITSELVEVIQKDYKENIITQEELAIKYNLGIISIHKILSNKHSKCIGDIKNNKSKGERHWSSKTKKKRSNKNI